MDKKIQRQKQIKKYAKDFVTYLQREYNLPIEHAFLFGSHAKGKQHNLSDIDVCVVSKRFYRADPLLYLWTRRRDVDVERRIEPYGMHPDDFVEENPVAHEVGKYGIRLL